MLSARLPSVLVLTCLAVASCDDRPVARSTSRIGEPFIETYDPSTGNWKRHPASPYGDRWFAFTVLAGQRLHFLCPWAGYSVPDASPPVTATHRIFDITSGAWSIGGDYPFPSIVGPAHFNVANGIRIFATEPELEVIDHTLGYLKYEDSTGTWAYKSGPPSSMSWAYVLQSGSSRYLFGAYFPEFASLSPPPTLGTDAFVYNLPANTWSVIPAQSVLRHHAYYGVVGGKIYIIGGSERVLGTNGPQLIGSVASEVYDISTGIWSRLADMPEVRTNAVCLAIPGHVYVFGGLRPGGALASDVYHLDVASGQWGTIAGPAQGVSAGCSSITVGGQFYFVGGVDSRLAPINAVIKYDPGSGIWTSLKSLTTARSVPKLFVSTTGQIHVVGGKIH